MKPPPSLPGEGPGDVPGNDRLPFLPLMQASAEGALRALPIDAQRQAEARIR